MELNLDVLQALPIKIEANQRWVLMLIGCGGTGSWLAPSIVRIARLLWDLSRPTDVLFVDPDTVERKNVYRQNFSDRDIGQNKAETLALRYSAVWGVEIAYAKRGVLASDFQMPYGRSKIVIDCVDNSEARAKINKHIYRGHWWISCGNARSSGQVLCGMHGIPEDLKKFIQEGKLLWAPDPALQEPELIQPQKKGGVKGVQTLSCAEMALIDSQGLSINQTIASIASDYLIRLLVSGTLQRMGTYLDYDSGSMRSIYTTLPNIQKYVEGDK